MGLILYPVTFILHAVCKCGFAAAVALVQAPVALVSVAVGAGVKALAVPHITQGVPLQGCPASR